MGVNLTGWFDGLTKPKRKGVYQQMSGNGTQLGYQYWDGLVWHPWCLRVDAAKAAYTKGSSGIDRMYQNDPWRGLAKPPNRCR